MSLFLSHDLSSTIYHLYLSKKIGDEIFIDYGDNDDDIYFWYHGFVLEMMKNEESEMVDGETEIDHEMVDGDETDDHQNHQISNPFSTVSFPLSPLILSYDQFIENYYEKEEEEKIEIEIDEINDHHHLPSHDPQSQSHDQKEKEIFQNLISLNLKKRDLLMKFGLQSSPNEVLREMMNEMVDEMVDGERW